MEALYVCGLLLAVTSTSLGTPLIKGQAGWFEQKGVKRQQQGSKMTPLTKFQDGKRAIEIMTKTSNDEVPPPKSFDWRKKGVISPVKNQGQIGNSVAIAAEECVESLLAIKKGQLVDLSIPEVQDCCPSGLADNIFECIHNIGGLCSRQTYPVSTGHCRNASCQSEVQIQGVKTVPAKQVMQMTEALLINPLLVLVDASKTSFEMYRAGVYSDPDCSKEQVDHAMQVVGYGEEDGKEYWICKNSWGASWGENGYIRILKGSDMCGIESFAQYPY